MTTTAEDRSPWLRSAGWDGFWMLSGLWILVPVLGFSAMPAALHILLVASSLLLWLAHRFATTYNAFCTPAYRSLVREQRGRFLVLPAAIFLLVFGFVFVPLPLDTWGKVQVLGTIFFVYNTYHFGVQHYGVLSIYRIRRGQNPASGFKRYEKAFCLCVGGVMVAAAQICHGAEVVYDSLIYRVVDREVICSAFAPLQAGVPATIVVLTGLFCFREFREEQVSLPKLLYVSALSLQGIMAYFLEPVPFLILWGVQHWLVSVALAAHMAQNDPSPAPSRWYGFWDRFNRGFWPTVFVLCLVSVLLAPFFEFVVHPDKLSSGSGLEAFFRSVLAHENLVRLTIGLSFATVYLHFVMDRAIFRFSNAAVRKVSLPLLFSYPK